jgi:hypothetical protein
MNFKPSDEKDFKCSRQVVAIEIEDIMLRSDRVRSVNYFIDKNAFVKWW